MKLSSAPLLECPCGFFGGPARDVQMRRGFYNAHIPHRMLRKLCVLDDAGERTLEMAVRRMGLSARAHTTES